MYYKGNCTIELCCVQHIFMLSFFTSYLSKIHITFYKTKFSPKYNTSILELICFIYILITITFKAHKLILVNGLICFGVTEMRKITQMGNCFTTGL